MPIYSVNQARKNLYRLIDQTTESHQPVHITGKRNHAVLLCEDDWNAVQETLHLLSIPGMRESIRQDMAAPLDECDKALNW